MHETQTACSTEPIDQLCMKHLYALGAFGCPLLPGGGLAQAQLHTHQVLQEIYLHQCTWRNASSIKKQLKRNPYYLNMGARLVNLKAHMKPISCNFVAIYNWGVCVRVHNWFQMQVTTD